MGINIAFWVLGVTAVGGALLVISMRSLLRAALGLILCFIAIAGLFITLSADFLGLVQVLIYVGAIAILIIVGIMLTREAECANMPNQFKVPALIAAFLFLGLSAWAVLNTSWPVSPDTPTAPTTAALGNLLFGQGGLALAIEIAAVLLLAAIIGAISIAREK